MTELDNKFIIMARIAVVMRKKGFQVIVTLLDSMAMLNASNDISSDCHCLYSSEWTESELLELWSAIENDVH